MTQEDASALGRRLLDAGGFTGWSLEWSPAAPSECWHASHKLMMWDGLLDNSWWYVKEAIIHEMAHILGYGEMPSVAHGPSFFERYGVLLIKLADMR